MERRLGHPNDRQRVAADADRTADDRGVGAERSLPHPIAQDHDRMSPWCDVIGWHERSPELRLYAEHVEVIAGDLFGPDALALRPECQAERLERGARNSFKRILRAHETTEIGMRQRNDAARGPRRQHTEMYGVLHTWDRLECERPEQAEDEDVGANAEGKHDQHDDRVTGTV